MARRNRDRKRRNRETRRRLAQERMPVVIRRRLGPRFRALQVEKGLEHFTVMLALATGKNTTANDVVANGTGTLVNSGQKPLIITNYHVYNKFKLDRASDSHAKLIMSAPTARTSWISPRPNASAQTRTSISPCFRCHP